MTERLDIAHDLPEELADALADDARTAGTLYNELQDLSDEGFATRFEAPLAALREAVDGVDAPLVIAVVGLAVDVDEGPLVADAALVSAHEPQPDGGIERLLYTADETTAVDTFLMLPLRPTDCPPGSGQPASALSLSAFREVVSAMAYKRFDLLNEDIDAYCDSYLRPLVRGLEAYA
ncbi:hypothetical protein [Halosegnis sp.]|uniref:hypothetical protein n=1 Tax=Halosegnis sp. TaxID=2864959 RepID=UPI0035D4079D